MNYWAIAFPSLMYLASIGMCSSLFRKPMAILFANVVVSVTAILWCYYRVGLGEAISIFQIPYFSICLALNVILTLMIIVRLVLHSRNIRKAIGASSGPVSLYSTIITMLVESSALYAVGHLLYIVPTVSNSYVASIFSSALGEIQVRALFTLLPSLDIA